MRELFSDSFGGSSHGPSPMSPTPSPLAVGRASSAPPGALSAGFVPSFLKKMAAKASHALHRPQKQVQFRSRPCIDLQAGMPMVGMIPYVRRVRYPHAAKTDADAGCVHSMMGDDGKTLSLSWGLSDTGVSGAGEDGEEGGAGGEGGEGGESKDDAASTGVGGGGSSSISSSGSLRLKLSLSITTGAASTGGSASPASSTALSSDAAPSSPPMTTTAPEGQGAKLEGSSGSEKSGDGKEGGEKGDASGSAWAGRVAAGSSARAGGGKAAGSAACTSSSGSGSGSTTPGGGRVQGIRGRRANADLIAAHEASPAACVRPLHRSEPRSETYLETRAVSVDELWKHFSFLQSRPPDALPSVTTPRVRQLSGGLGVNGGADESSATSGKASRKRGRADAAERSGTAKRNSPRNGAAETNDAEDTGVADEDTSDEAYAARHVAHLKIMRERIEKLREERRNRGAGNGRGRGRAGHGGHGNGSGGEGGRSPGPGRPPGRPAGGGRSPGPGRPPGRPAGGGRSPGKSRAAARSVGLSAKKGAVTGGTSLAVGASPSRGKRSNAKAASPQTSASKRRR